MARVKSHVIRVLTIRFRVNGSLPAITLHIVVMRAIDAGKLTHERSYSCPNANEELVQDLYLH